MSGGFYGEFLTTVGMEYESIALTQDSVRAIVQTKLAKKLGKLANAINITRDASTEFIAEYVPVGSHGILVSTHTPAAKEFLQRGLSKKTMGFEIFTTPMQIPDFEQLIYPLIYELQAAGDFTSQRAAIHFHYGFVNNLRHLQNLLRICLNLEPVLYRLGGMGGTFRGHCNASAYARPLLNSAAVLVISKPTSSDNVSDIISGRRKHQYVQIINPMAALEATSIAEFWASFGIDYPGGGSGKYHPSRYSGTNFYAIPAHGTIEFRHFNQSHRIPLLVAIAKFLRSTVELSTVIGKNEVQQFQPINSNIEVPTDVAAELINRLSSLFAEKEIENSPSAEEINLLIETVANSHFIEIPESPVVKTHVDAYVEQNLVTLGKLKLVQKISEPQHIDIHTIQEKTVSIFD